MNKILETKNLTKTFEMKEHKVHALKKVNFQVQRGDYISIQGPSGSGKTTLLNMMGCLDQPTEGDIIIDGTNPTDLSGNEISKLRAKKIGFIFQSFNLMPILNAVENVELPMELIKLSNEKKRRKAEKLLELVGLSDRMHHRPNELSAGQMQRVGIARALANSPAIILADEPTGNLDSETGKNIMDLLNKLNEKLNTTIIVVTHDNAMAKLTNKRIYMKDGKIT